MSNIMSIIFILAALGITFGYTSPKYNSTTANSDLTADGVAELKNLRTEYEAAIQKAAEIEEVRNGLLTKYNSISNADRDRISKLIPDNIDSVRLVIDINNIASSYGMSLRDISLVGSDSTTQNADNQAVVAQSPLYSYLTLDFSVSGSYNNLVSFLGSLEKSLRIADVTNMDIAPVSSLGNNGATTAKSGISAEPLYEMKISVHTYYLNSK